jgi:WD40 repeat protein
LESAGVVLAGEPAIDPAKARVVNDWTYERPLLACRMSPTGAIVVTSSEDFSLQRWDLTSGKPLQLKAHESWVHALEFSSDGTELISGGCEGNLVWWPILDETPQPKRTIAAHQGWIRAIARSPDNRLLASVGNDTIVRLWSLSTGEKVAELAGHERHVYSVLFHPDGRHLLTGDLMGKVHLWDIEARKLERSLDAGPLHTYEGGQRVDFGGVRGLALQPNGSQVLAAGLHKATNPLGAVHEPLVLRLDYADGKLLKSHVCDGIPGGVIWRVQCLPDGTAIAVCGGSTGGFLLFFNDQQDKDIARFKLPALARDMDWHAPSARVATVHHDRHLRIVAFG